jgi:cyclopropane-fatty-acyl-phospholipid synthase
MTDEAAASSCARQQRMPDLLSGTLLAVGKRLLRWKPTGSLLIVLPNGRTHRFGERSPEEAVLELQNYSVVRKALSRGSLGFAQAYLDGDIESPDLAALFRFFLRNKSRLHESGSSLFRSRLFDRIMHRLRRNTRRGSRENISEHYDLGNEFFRLWLSEDLFYSSGYFAAGAESLEEAQIAKASLVLDALELRPGQTLLEIGCGWGSLSIRAARERDVSASGITLSSEQLAHAITHANASGLAGSCRFELKDYRDTSGQFERIASIEMIEAVGEENWPRYFRTLHDRLAPEGVAVLQAITINEADFPAYRRRADFVQRYIFPGGMLPTKSAMKSGAERAGLSFETVATFGASYARTLHEWRRRFETNWPEIARLGFDERFRRKWRYYLAYCEAGFLEGSIDVGVYRLRKPASSS